MIRTRFCQTFAYFLLALLGATFFDSCANGGGGVDVPNSIHNTLQGVVTSDSGCRTDRSEIHIRPVGWNPVEGASQPTWNTTASLDGAFSLAAPDTGNWILEARDTLGGCGTVRAFTSAEIASTSHDKPFAVRLQKSADLSGTIVPVPGGVSESDPTRWTIVVPGLDQTATPDSQGNWNLDNVPSGTFVPTAIASSSTVRAVLPLASVTINPGGQILLAPVVVGSNDTSTNRSAKGLVLTENGKLAPGATVSLYPLESGNTERTTRTDDSGRFALALPASGSWIFTAGTANETFSDTIRSADLSVAALPATLARIDTLRMTTRPSPRIAIDDWEPREDALAIPSYVKQSPLSSDQAWIGYSDGRVYLSTGTGRNASPTWTRLDSASDGHGGIIDTTPGLAVTAIAPVSSNDGYSAYIAFAGNKQGGKFWKVNYSGNGLTWTDLSSKLSAGDIQNIEISGWSSIVYVLAAGALWYSVDYGATFTKTQPNNDPYQPPTDTVASAVSAFARHAQKDLLVAGTIDGQIWTATPITPPNKPVWQKIGGGAGSGLPAKMISSIVFDDRDTTGNTIYASFGGRTSKAIWVTRDRGQKWSSIYNPGLPDYGGGFGLDVASVSIAPAPGATTLYTYTDVGTYRSDDGGSNWSNKPRKAAPRVP